MAALDRAVTLFVGALLVGFSLYFGSGAARDTLRFGDQPLPVTLDEATRTAREGRQWVRVAPGGWRCDEAVRRGVQTLVPARSSDGAVVVARFEDLPDCERAVAAPVTGIVEPALENGVASALVSAGVLGDLQERAVQLDVCSSCGREDAFLGVVLCSVLGLVGLFFGPLRRRVPNLGAVVDAKMTEAAYASDAASANGMVQAYGFAVALGGACCFWFGDGWAIFVVIPLTWFGVFAGALGAFMMTFPERYRTLVRRARRR